MNRYFTKTIHEIFPGLLIDYLSLQNISEKNMQLIMNQVEQYEKQHNVRFVQFWGELENPVLIFERL